MKLIQIVFLFFIFNITVSASEQKLEKVTLQLQWKHQFEFAGFYAAQAKGFYEEAGLDVEFREFNGTTYIVDEVLSERATYGLGYSSIILDYMNAKPIVMMANFFKQSPLILVTQKEITSLSQLRGTKIEGLANNIHNITLYTMLSKFGIKGSDIETVDPSFSVEAFLAKEVDAMSAFSTNEIFLLDKAGAKYNVFDPVSYGAKYYDVNLFTSKKELYNNPERARKFKEASIRGWEYALKHKEEIIELILEKYNTQAKTKESLLFEALQVEHVMLPSVHKIGSVDINRVKIIAESFLQSRFSTIDKVPSFDDFLMKAEMKRNEFTQDEIKYLKEKKIITVCVDPSWMPIEAVVDGKYVGIASDYWKLFEKKLGVDIGIFKTDSWNGSVEAMKQDKCDVLSLSAPTQERKESISFTDSFLNLSLVIVTKLDKKNVLDFSLLDGISVAIVKGYALIDAIRIKYPKINIIEVSNIEDGLKKVTEGEVFGFADSAVAIDYEYKNGSYDDFKVSAHFDEKLNLGLGISHDNVRLFNILQKVIKSVSYNQKQEVLRKWFSSTYATKFDYILFWQFFAFIFIIIGLALYRHYAIKKINKELNTRVEMELKKSFDRDKMIFHQSKLVAMGEMMENIAHQWRQPLSQVNSCVLVIDDTLDSQGIHNTIIEEKMHEIESLTQYMSNTIDDFRNFFDQNKVKENIIVENIIKKSLEVLKGRIQKYKIVLIVDYRTAHEYFTHSNELQQVLLVILNNAIDMLVINDIAKPSIKVEIKKIKEELIITICDNAGGVSEEVVEKIFEPYYTTKHKTQGTGLGLYISKIIIEDSLGGELKVKNSFSGACFTITLKPSIDARKEINNGDK